MKQKRIMRHVVLSRLFEHLHENYGLDWSREVFVDGQISSHQIDAALAFKSDSHLDELSSALHRLDDGTYGVCIHCKSPISQETLAADPTQRLCPSCEQAYTHVLAGRFETRAHA